jgi:hypothetical protein
MEMWCIYTEEYYSTLKRKEILLFLTNELVGEHYAK